MQHGSHYFVCGPYYFVPHMILLFCTLISLFYTSFVAVHRLATQVFCVPHDIRLLSSLCGQPAERGEVVYVYYFTTWMNILRLLMIQLPQAHSASSVREFKLKPQYFHVHRHLHPMCYPSSSHLDSGWSLRQRSKPHESYLSQIGREDTVH